MNPRGMLLMNHLNITNTLLRWTPCQIKTVEQDPVVKTQVLLLFSEWPASCDLNMVKYGNIKIWAHNRHPIPAPHRQATGACCKYFRENCYQCTFAPAQGVLVHGLMGGVRDNVSSHIWIQIPFLICNGPFGATIPKQSYTICGLGQKRCTVLPMHNSMC